jgi:hypothetical protein
MSTRRYLKEREKFFEHIVKKNPGNIAAQDVVDEIKFIFKALKDYDPKRSKTK